ncbi:TPA: hypothetical protein L0X66_001789 [Citrobacter freundii]|uniref:hypothetical protein n=1 Tax=Escherichia coli TaxID=562 RepID=UPI002B2FC625|nr:hypothetical protein VEE23_32790 [Escherichia coli]HBM9257457.1 hypothetical protein [Citrobacter freundii]HCO0724926.1 hypothetical protein [Escherichia coli]
MTDEQAKQVFKPILIALTVVGVFFTASCVNSTITIDASMKRDIICANQEYDPQTAKLDMDVCRKTFQGN